MNHRAIILCTLLTSGLLSAATNANNLNSQAERAISDLVYECKVRFSEDTLQAIQEVLVESKAMINYVIPLQKRGFSMDKLQQDKKLSDLTQKIFLALNDLSMKVVLELNIDPSSAQAVEELSFLSDGIHAISVYAGLDDEVDELRRSHVMSQVIECALKHLKN